MSQRPLSVTVISCLFIATGAIGFVYHSMRISAQHLFAYDGVWISLVSLAAIVAGVFMFRGRNWARWLTILWIVFHVIVSAFHPIRELVIHLLLLLVIAYFLWRSPAKGFFRGAL